MTYLFIKDGKIIGHYKVDNDMPSRVAKAVRDQKYPGAKIAVMLSGEGYP